MLSLVQATDTAHQGQRLVDAERTDLTVPPIDIGAWLRQHGREHPVWERLPTDTGWADWTRAVWGHRHER